MEINNSKNVIQRSKNYFIYLVITLMFVEITDTYTTLYPTAIPSKVIEEFLLPFHPLNVANSIMYLVISIGTIGTYFVFLNQFLADKIGRKKMLAFTVFGMGFSSLLLLTSTTIVSYTICLFLLYMFFSSDIWTIYISEEAPEEKRALWTNIVLMGGLFGAVLITIFRAIFISETGSYWRGMTFASIFIGIPLSIIILLTLKEPKKYLEMKENKVKEEKSTRSLINDVKSLFLISNRNGYIAILISGFIISLNIVFGALLEQFLTTSPYISDDDATLIILIISLATFIGYLFTGIVADKYGRKRLFYCYALLYPISVIFVVIGSNLEVGAIIIVSISAGFAYISGQCSTVLIRIVSLEIVPTEMRGLGTGVKSLISAFGATLGTLLATIPTLYFGLGTTFILFSLLFLIIIPLVYLYLKETKGIDLGSVE